MNKIAKKITTVLLVATLMIGSTLGVIAAEPIIATESTIATEPIRYNFEAAGATVTWDNENRLIVIEMADNTIVLEPDSNVALFNDMALALSRPIYIENGISFIETRDLTALSSALTVGEHGLTIATAQTMATQFMELAHIPDFSMAIVNTNTGFSWTKTMSDATDTDTIFHLGSVSKTFTAVAVMQLVEQGLLDLDTPIVEYIPEFSTLPSTNGEGNYRNITARMLLSHTAGIYTNDSGSGAITYGRHYESYMNDFLARFANFRMVREEGTAFDYANSGYMLLGILVARIAGHDNYFEGFNQYMLENIFEPMGLTRTSYVITRELRQFVAQPYLMTDMPQEFLYWNLLSTGTMFTTANEMVSLMTMFLNDGYYNGHQILKPESIDQMFTDQTGTGQYGLGVAFLADPSGSGNILIGHTGGMMHNFAIMLIDREHGIGVFAASNSTTSLSFFSVLGGAVLATAITEVGGEFALPVSHIDPLAVPVELTVEKLETLAGFYLLAGGIQHLFVELVDRQLYLRIPAQEINILLAPMNEKIALIPMSDGHFATEMGIPFWLIPDGDGNVFFVQGPNRYTVAGVQSNTNQFIPNEDFMENRYGFTFKAYKEQDFYRFIIPSITFGVNENGFAYRTTVILNLFPNMEWTMLEPMDTDLELYYENGEYFLKFWGKRFVRQ